MRTERGTAVIMAMLVVAVATTLVAGALWQQSALIRETENERALSQARWLLRGAIDWAGVILQEDARTSSVDHRGEPWAVPLADTRLNESDGRPAAYLAGSIDDEQAKFNLRNLLAGTDLNGGELQALRRLLGALRIEERLADKIGERLLAAQKARSSEPAIGLAYVDDLREAVPSVADTGLAVTTRYFSVEGMVSYGPARLAAHALVRREPVTLEVLWMKEAG